MTERRRRSSSSSVVLYGDHKSTESHQSHRENNNNDNEDDNNSQSDEVKVVYQMNRGKNARFRPGQGCHPASALFLRTVIRPAVGNHVSDSTHRIISVFNYLNNIVLSTVIQLYLCVGLWSILLKMWPDSMSYEIRDGIYILIGIVIAGFSMRFYSMEQSFEDMEAAWRFGIPTTFGWRRKLDAYLRETVSFMGYIFCWVGTWDFIDLHLFDRSEERNIVYLIIPILLGFFVEEVLSPESMYYIAAKYFKRNNPTAVFPTETKESFTRKASERFFRTNSSQNLTGEFSPANDWFIREIIQPKMTKIISPSTDTIIRITYYLFDILIIRILNVFQWVGFWDLLDDYWRWSQDKVTREVSYACVGFFIMFLCMKFLTVESSDDDLFAADSWYRGVPEEFGTKRKFVRFCRDTFSFFGFLLCWVGSWDFIDILTIPDSFERNILYVVVPLIIGFIFNNVLSVESLYYMAAVRSITYGNCVGECCGDDNGEVLPLLKMKKDATPATEAAKVVSE